MTGLLPSTVEPWVAIPAGAEVELSWRQGIFGHIKMVLVWEGRWRPIPLEQPSVLTCRVLKKMESTVNGIVTDSSLVYRVPGQMNTN